ncbi:ParB/RepB/Spo0J family partition protein [Paenibacillus pseudetheri]|uniref:ParB/Sulfiredoxin domain-containing protein n=1 Tax=Paenibacillus pseudetheri TaxID=2897682 RepID=A0ABM9BF43_9BACL|nr:ParB N-terminal domain-containing protein [Paenibacillus pseudetheri]CAH1056820.1 hypothetical protein PAECIP111894_02975 [Paenibacillus pseudetheri]
MQLQQCPVQLIEQIFQYIHKSKPEYNQIRKDYAALGLLSVYSGLFNSWDSLKGEKEELRRMGAGKYLDNVLQKIFALKSDDTVTELVDYVKELGLSIRKEDYRQAAENMKRGKRTEGGRYNIPNSSSTLLLASMNFGIQIYQQFIMKGFNNSEDTEKYPLEILNEIDLKEIGDMKHEQESQAIEVLKNKEHTSDSESSTIEPQTSDKQIVTSNERKNNLSSLIGKPFQTTSEYEFHDYADMLPLMTNDELALLTEGIRSNGQYEPILFYNNQIADGRNRYKACKLAGIPVLVSEWLGSEEELVLYIYEKNVNRRDLTSSQRAMSSYKLLSEARRLAKLRQGERNDLKVSLEEVINSAYPVVKRGRVKNNQKHRADEAVAKELKTNRTYVNNAAFIYENAQELMEPVLRKELTITKAYQLAKKLSPEERIKVLNEFKEKKRSIDAIVKSIKSEDDTINDNERKGEIVIITPHDVTLSEEDIKQLEAKYEMIVKVQTRRKPKDITNN